jgi:uncharacterized membrane protein YvlD (DUF360 family)
MKAFGIRLLVALVLNAIALWIASLLLDQMTINGIGFVVAVIIFSVVQAAALPIARAMMKEYASRLAFLVSLIVTFLALLAADVFSRGISIEGIGTWILATLIVWLAGIVLEFVSRAVIPKEAAAS